MQTEFSASHPEPISWRPILITLFLLPIFYWWHIECEALPSFGPPPTLMSPLYTVVLALLILTSLNFLLKRFYPKHTLTGGELITVYVLMSMSLIFMSYDMFLPLVSIVVHAFYFATPENEWRDLFFHYLPDWLTISNPEIGIAFYRGEKSFFEPRYFLAWVKPIFWWCSFAFVWLLVTQCINVIIRKAWAEQERLTYPIVEIPYQLAYNSGTFFRSKAMWAGFAIAGGISLINGLHVLFPIIPVIPTKSISIAPLFTEKPWTALLRGGSTIVIYPFAVGLFFLMPMDLLMSCLLFFFVYKMQFFMAIVTGMEQIPGFPYPYEQQTGAYTGICVIALWATRRQIWRALKAVIRPQPEEEREEPMRYRTAFLGVVLGGLFLIGFAMRGGMGFRIALLFFAAHFATIAIPLTRLRAQIGFPIHSTTFIGPHHSLVSLLGTRQIGAQNLTWFSLFFWFNRDNRSHPMPHQLEAFKLSERGHLDVKRLSRWMLAILIVAMPMCLIMLLETFFRLGVDTGNIGGQINSFGGRAYRFLHGWLTTPRDPQNGHIAAMSFGFCFTLILGIVRARFFWWPIHPLGYGISLSSHMFMFWAPFIIAGVAKWSLLKYGGIVLYRRAIPLFLGLALGDFVMGSFWSLLGILLKRPTYTFYFG